MLISEAAKLSGLSAKMIRRYEEMGLLSSQRQANGYRHYGQQDIDTLRFIAQAKKLGFSLQDIQELTLLWSNPQRSSAQVKMLATQHIQQLEANAQELLNMATQLKQLAEQCRGDADPECAILNGLDGAQA